MLCEKKICAIFAASGKLILLGVSEHVADLKWMLPSKQRARQANGAPSDRGNCVTFHVLSICTPVPIAGGKLKENLTPFGRRKVGHESASHTTRGRLYQRVEHDLQVEG